MGRLKQEKTGFLLGVDYARCARALSRELLGTAGTAEPTELLTFVRASEQHGRRSGIRSRSRSGARTEL